MPAIQLCIRPISTHPFDSCCTAKYNNYYLQNFVIRKMNLTYKPKRALLSLPQYAHQTFSPGGELASLQSEGIDTNRHLRSPSTQLQVFSRVSSEAREPEIKPPPRAQEATSKQAQLRFASNLPASPILMFQFLAHEDAILSCRDLELEGLLVIAPCSWGGGGKTPAPRWSGGCPSTPKDPFLTVLPIVSAQDTMLLVAERSERAERAEGDCERDEIELATPEVKEREGDRSRERIEGERERELYGVPGGDGYGESLGENEGSDCDSHLCW